MQYILYFVAVVNFLLSVVVLVNNFKNSQNKYFSSFAFFGSFWALGTALLLYGRTSDIVYLGQFLFFVAPLWTAYFILLFSLVFPYNARITLTKRLLLFVYPLLLSVAYILNSDWFVQTVINQSQNVMTVTETSYAVYALFFFAYLGIAPRFLFKARDTKNVSNLLKSQINHAAIAISLTSAVSAFTNLIFPVLGRTNLIWAGPLTGLPFVVLISLAVVRYKLFNIRLVVARSLAYIASFIVISLGYFYISSVITNFARQEFNDRPSIEYAASFLILTLTAVLFRPVKDSFDKLTNRLFYRDAYDAQAFLDQLNKELVSNVDLESLLTRSSVIIQSNLKPDFCVFGLKETTYSPQRAIGTTKKEFNDEDVAAIRELTAQVKHSVIVADELEDDNRLKKLMREYDIAILARLATDLELQKTEGLGYVMLGSKKSGNPYNTQDVKMVEIITNELVIAIQNALRFEEIEKFNITLQERVDNATAQLRRSNSKLKEMDETKDEFISMASHQLRTPLTSVKGYLSMVLEGDAGKITAQQRKLLDQAFISSQRMVYLIADLLNVSRLKAGKFIIESQPTNLADLVEGEVAQLKEVAAGRNLELKYDKPKNMPLLNLDETKIRQVVMNFIDNAIYYTPSGGHITVMVGETPETVEFKVVDDGLGVPKHEQHNLFTKFYRAANAKKARPDGTGLGLFMAKKVIIAQGGSIIFNSQENKGSTFGFAFAKAKLELPDHKATIK